GRGAAVEDGADGRQGGADAAVVGDVAVGVGRHVEVDADEDALAVRVRQGGEGLLGHCLCLFFLPPRHKRNKGERKKSQGKQESRSGSAFLLSFIFFVSFVSLWFAR